MNWNKLKNVEYDATAPEGLVFVFTDNDGLKSRMDKASLLEIVWIYKDMRDS